MLLFLVAPEQLRLEEGTWDVKPPGRCGLEYKKKAKNKKKMIF